MRPTHTRADFDHSPMIVFYETTRACDLACVHCRANAQRERDPSELSTEAARRMIVDLTKFPKPPLDACNTYRALFDSLRELEQDMHRHVHKENSILFPKALELEQKLSV